ncbi:MAG: hypothetical protein QM597_01835 [Aeromicrobium sp.]|uniref:hypothetical protein n=1 Tax=Aeromicrobium sp. TaxID=1871063 RepID=UPI0039E63E34
MILRADGGVDLFEESGEIIGNVDPPWAVDAAGAEVPTHFEVDGLTLTQVVEHIGGDWEYGIVADPSTNAWGACGLRTSPTKVVDRYPGKGGTYTLRCGDKNYGYRHILQNHRSQFEALAAGTGKNWRDVADMAMTWAAKDPDKTVMNVGGGKGCKSRLLFLRNNRTNQVVRQQRFAMYYVNSSLNIVTVYPKGSGC